MQIVKIKYLLKKNQNEDEIISYIFICLTLARNKLRIPPNPALNHIWAFLPESKLSVHKKLAATCPQLEEI